MIENFLSIDALCAVGSYQNLYINGWWDEATAPRLMKVREHRQRFIATHTGPLCALSLLYQSKLKVLPKESRKLVDDINRDGSDRFCAEAHFVNAGGLLLSSMRFLMSGLRLMSRVKTPFEVFGDQAEALRWLSRQASLPEETLTRVLEDFLKRQLR